MQHLDHFNDDKTPQGICVKRGRQGICIIRRWSKLTAYITLAWVVFWFALNYFFLSLGGHPIGAIALIPASIGLTMAYVSMTRFLNHTRIDATPLRLVVKHEPLPWLGSKSFATRDIYGLYESAKKVYTRSGPINIYRVMIVRQNGKKRVLLSGIELTELQADFIASEINKYLQTLPGRNKQR